MYPPFRVADDTHVLPSTMPVPGKGLLYLNGQLLVLRAEDPARLHAAAAVHHGATFSDLIAVAETAFVTGGVLAYSLGVRVAAEFAPPA